MSAPEEPKTPRRRPSLRALLQKVIARLGPLLAEHQSFRGDDCIHVAREHILEVGARRCATRPNLASICCSTSPASITSVSPTVSRTLPKSGIAIATWCASAPSGAIASNLPARGDAPRFAVVYHLVSTRLLHRLRVKCRVPEDNPVIASLSGAMVRRQLAGTRNLRPVRYPLRWPSGPPPHLSLRRIRRPSTAQGLRQTRRTTD